MLEKVDTALVAMSGSNIAGIRDLHYAQGAIPPFLRSGSRHTWKKLYSLTERRDRGMTHGQNPTLLKEIMINGA